MTVAHWDEVERTRRDVGDIRAAWRRLGAAAGATEIGVARVEGDPGVRIGPGHGHGAAEETFYVLGGSGLAWVDGEGHRSCPAATTVGGAGAPARARPPGRA